jgi:hypothetical protein
MFFLPRIRLRPVGLPCLTISDFFSIVLYHLRRHTLSSFPKEAVKPRPETKVSRFLGGSYELVVWS